MDIAPYELIDTPGSDLTIVFTSGQTKRNRFYHLWLPLIILLCCSFFLFFLNKKNIAGWLKWLPFLATIASLFLLFMKYTVAVRFNTIKIQVTKRWILFNLTTTYKVDELKSIAVKSVVGINSIYIFTKPGKKKLLLTFPGEEATTILITKQLSEKTNLQIEPAKTQKTQRNTKVFTEATEP